MKVFIKIFLILNIVFLIAVIWATNKILNENPNALTFLEATFLGDKTSVDAEKISDQSADPWANSDNEQKFYESEQDEYWVNRIRDGGLILHFRHFQRDKMIDAAIFDSWEINNQLNARDEWFGFSTCLTEKGIAEGKLLHKMLKHASIKVEKVISSPSCRAIETAQLGFGRVDQVWRSLLHRASIPASRHKDHAKDLHERLMKIHIPEEANIVLTGHSSTFGENMEILFAEPPLIQVDGRKQGGLLVIERTEQGLFARHVFERMYEYTQSLMDYPVTE